MHSVGVVVLTHVLFGDFQNAATNFDLDTSPGLTFVVRYLHQLNKPLPLSRKEVFFDQFTVELTLSLFDFSFTVGILQP